MANDAPDKIYLQWFGGPDDENQERIHESGMDVMWCEDKLSEDDIEYVRVRKA